MYTANTQYYNTRARAPVGAETQEGRVSLSACLLACQPMRLSVKPSTPSSFPPPVYRAMRKTSRVAAAVSHVGESISCRVRPLFPSAIDIKSEQASRD